MNTTTKLGELYDEGKLEKVPINTTVYECDPIYGPIATRVRDWNQKYISMLFGLHFYGSAVDAKEMGDKILHGGPALADIQRMCERYHNPFYDLMIENTKSYQ